MTTPTPMLAKVYNEGDARTRHIDYPCWTQPKLDGIRCLITERGPISRQGNVFYTLPHITQELTAVFQLVPGLVLDGELYAHDLKENFNEIVSLVKKQRPSFAELCESKARLQFWLFDCYNPSIPDWKWEERFGFIRSLPIDWSLENPIRLTPTCFVPDVVELATCYDNFLAEGYEGQMIRRNGPYLPCGETERRSPDLLKRKPTQQEDFLIVAVEEGRGKCAGMAGALICETSAGHRFNATPAFGYDKRKEILLDREFLVGLKASVKFQNWTPGEAPVPRFPRVVAIRNYE